MINMLFLKISRRLPARLRDLFPLDEKLISRWGIILGVFFLSVVIAPRAASFQRNFLFLLALIPAFLGFITLLRWPDLGLSLIIISGLVVPFAIGTGTQTSINLAFVFVILLAGLWIFQMIVMRESGIKHLSRPFWPAIAIILSTVVSFGFGQFHWYPVPAASTSAQVGGVMIFVLSVGAFLLVAYHLQSLISLRWLVWIFLALSGLFMIGRAVPISFGQNITRLYPSVAQNSMFWMWFGVLAYCQVAYNHKLHPGWRIAIGLALAAGMYVAFIPQRSWLSGWLPMLAAIGFCTFIARPRYSIFIGFFAIIFLIIYQQQAQSVVMDSDNSYSMMTRLAAWEINFKIIMKNPIFGLGPSNYYWYTALYPILGYYVPFNSHNNYIDILSQTGLVGLGAFLWFSWETGRLIWRIRERVPEGFERSFLYGCFGGLLGMVLSGMLGDWIFPFVYNNGFQGFRGSVLIWLFLGGAVALERLVPSASSVVETSTH